MKIFLWKLLINGAILIPALLWFTDDATLTGILLTTVVLTVLAYYAGDRMLLSITDNNTISTIADFLLAFVYLWAVSLLMQWTLSYLELTLISIALALAEFVFHLFVPRRPAARANIS